MLVAAFHCLGSSVGRVRQQLGDPERGGNTISDQAAHSEPESIIERKSDQADFSILARCKSKWPKSPPEPVSILGFAHFIGFQKLLNIS